MNVCVGYNGLVIVRPPHPQALHHSQDNSKVYGIASIFDMLIYIGENELWVQWDYWATHVPQYSQKWALMFRMLAHVLKIRQRRRSWSHDYHWSHDHHMIKLIYSWTIHELFMNKCSWTIPELFMYHFKKLFMNKSWTSSSWTIHEL